MIRTLTLGVTAALALSACQPGTAPPRDGATRGDLTDDLIRLRSPGPPPSGDGICWASDVTPAVIETVTEHVRILPARTNSPTGTDAPASFRTVTQQRIVKDREEVWFRTPCEAAMTVDFIATLQRALKARGLYRVAVNGLMDATTRNAIRRYQEPRGLNSEVLSLAAARDLGIVATDLSLL